MSESTNRMNGSADVIYVCRYADKPRANLIVANERVLMELIELNWGRYIRAKEYDILKRGRNVKVVIHDTRIALFYATCYPVITHATRIQGLPRIASVPMSDGVKTSV